MTDHTGLNADDVRVGATIRALRESYGMSRSELARAIGKSDKLIQKIESGERRALPYVCRDIADTLSIPLAAIVVRNWDQIRDRPSTADDDLADDDLAPAV